jgi:hypothetical protein
MSEPPGWRDDRLSEFLAQAQHNVRATFANARSAYSRLRDIDHQYHSLLENLDNLREPKEVAATFFCYRAHANYRAATGLALAGQAYESFVVDRACLESALYGFFVSHVEGAAETWLDRHENPEALEKMKRTFTARATIASLKAAAPQWGNAAEQLYEITINLGAHPNPQGLLGSAEMEHSSEGVKFSTVYLTDDTVQLQAGLKVCAQAGLTALGVASFIFSTRAKLLGVADWLPTLAQGL